VAAAVVVVVAADAAVPGESNDGIARRRRRAEANDDAAPRIVEAMPLLLLPVLPLAGAAILSPTSASLASRGRSTRRGGTRPQTRRRRGGSLLPPSLERRDVDVDVDDDDDVAALGAAIPVAAIGTRAKAEADDDAAGQLLSPSERSERGRSDQRTATTTVVVVVRSRWRGGSLIVELIVFKMAREDKERWQSNSVSLRRKRGNRLT